VEPNGVAGTSSAGARLSVSVRHVPLCGIVVDLAGELDIGTRRVLDDSVDAAAAAAGDVVVTTTQLSFIDGYGLQGLLRLQDLGAVRRRLRICSPSAPMVRILELIEFTALIDTASSGSTPSLGDDPNSEPASGAPHECSDAALGRPTRPADGALLVTSAEHRRPLSSSWSPLRGPA